MSGVWQGLLSSLAIVGAVTSVWTHVRSYLPTSRLLQSVAFGSVMGAGSVLSMIATFEVQPGVSLDMRSALLSVTGFFGGPVAAILAATIGVSYRLAQGGVGAPAGSLSIVCAALIGTIGRRYIGAQTIRERHIVVLSLITATSCALSLLAMPQPIRAATLPLFGGPMLLLLFGSTLIAGLALLHDTRLQESLDTNRTYRAIVEMLPDCLNFKTATGAFQLANTATAKLMRANTVQDLIGKTDFEFYPEEIAKGFREDELAVMAGVDAKTIEQKASFPDGSIAWLSTLKMPTRNNLGQVVGLITLNRDVTEQKHLQEKLQIAHEHLEDALANMADGLVLYDRNGIIQFSNQQYRQLFPMTFDLRISGAALADIIRESINRGEEQSPETDDFEAWLAQRCRTALSAANRTIQLSNSRWIEARTKIVRDGGSLILYTDITDRKRAEETITEANAQLARLAWSDGLTGLTNRRGFDQAFEKEFARCGREEQFLGLLLIDVDNFKAYNDSYGHQAGDLCLRLIGEALRAVLRRSSDLSARYGGEEFVALLPYADFAGAAQVAESIRRAVEGLKLPHDGSDHKLVTISVGVTAHIPGYEIKQPEELLHRADKALYVAKSQGRNRVHPDHRLSAPSMPAIKLVRAS